MNDVLHPPSPYPTLRILVFGHQGVGKSALTVRYLTRRYIGEYKSNADLLYRRVMSVKDGPPVDIEIVDISTSENVRKTTFPNEEFLYADCFVIVYSITDRKSFETAIEAMTTLAKATKAAENSPSPSPSAVSKTSSSASTSSLRRCRSRSTSTSSSGSSKSSSLKLTSSPRIRKPPTTDCPIVLLGNKCDMFHCREVETAEAQALADKFGCSAFYEVSAADNTPELYTAFHTLVQDFMDHQPVAKRKFSVSKMLGNLRLGKSSSNSDKTPTILSTEMIASDCSIDPTEFGDFYGNRCYSRPHTPPEYFSNRLYSSNVSVNVNVNVSKPPPPSTTKSEGKTLTEGFCHLKSKLVEFHSLKKRHNSPPICSL